MQTRRCGRSLMGKLAIHLGMSSSSNAHETSILFAYPKELEARRADYPLLFDTFYPSFKEEKGIKEYLASDRRLPYSMGLFRHYPELDRQ